ncbi:MAG: hypothetical protein V2A69_15910 [Pseudomonadota bacterium]
MPVEILSKSFRVLWHQTLAIILKYPELPRRTWNFDSYPVFKRRIGNQMTLSSMAVTSYAGTIEDTKVSEVWLADDISMRAGFFYELYRFFNTTLNTGDYLVWYPKDKTENAFCIEPVDLICGSSEEMKIHPIHNGITNHDYRWLREEVRFDFLIKKVIDAPEVVAYLEGR